VPRDSRVALIQTIERLRGCRVVALVLGDRPGQETRMAADVVPLLSRHLRAIGKDNERIDLFLYTTGGDIMAAFRLVPLIREYCQHFGVIVPARCQSAGTLVALGADAIIMLPEGQLSPVDPSTNGPYNPMIPGVPPMPGAPIPTLPVSVEEVIGYLKLAQEVAEIRGERGLVSVFEKLTTDVRPVALGQVYRARTQIRMLSRKLLESHMKGDDGGTVEKIIKYLTEELYSHDYLITRVEAKQLGLKVEHPAPELEQPTFDLYCEYESMLQLREPFNPVQQLAQKPQAKLLTQRACLETTERLDVFSTESDWRSTPQGPMGQIIREGWVQQ
jgi:hypothetical protein